MAILAAAVVAGPAATGLGVAAVDGERPWGAVTERVSVDPDAGQANKGSIEPAISADGRDVAFASGASNLVPGDTNNSEFDVFVRDREAGVTRRVSVGQDGGQANDASWSAAISADAQHVAFESHASNLVPGDTNKHRDVFVRHRIRTGP